MEDIAALARAVPALKFTKSLRREIFVIRQVHAMMVKQANQVRRERAVAMAISQDKRISKPGSKQQGFVTIIRL